MKATTICEGCETVYQGGKNSFLCPKCRKERLSYYAKQRKLNEIGNKAYSDQCAETKTALREENTDGTD